jgi:hypothetical protein
MSAAPALTLPPPPRKARIGRSSIIAAAVGVFVGVAVVATVIVLVRDPGTPAPTCRPPESCGPPQGPPGLVSLSVWDSPLGYSFRYDAARWTVEPMSDGTGAVLKLFGREDAVLRVVGSEDATPEEALAALADSIRETAPDLAEDVRNFRRVLGPAVGYLDGVGASFAGTTDSPQGPGHPVLVSAMSARAAGVTVTVSVVMIGDRWQERIEGGWLGEQVFGLADSVINTVTWVA